MQNQCNSAALASLPALAMAAGRAKGRPGAAKRASSAPSAPSARVSSLLAAATRRHGGLIPLSPGTKELAAEKLAARWGGSDEALAQARAVVLGEGLSELSEAARGGAGSPPKRQRRAEGTEGEFENRQVRRLERARALG